jgi:CBS domain-containing protein
MRPMTAAPGTAAPKTAATIMTREVVHVAEGDDVQVVAKRLLESGHHSLPVLDQDGRVVGMIGERDLIDAHRQIHLPTVLSLLDSVIPISGWREYEEELRKATAVTALQLATPKPEVAHLGDSVESLADRILKRNLHALPVVDDGGHLLGIVSRSDILRALIQGS